MNYAALVLCDGCDALQAAPRPAGGRSRGRCVRCGADLPWSSGDWLDQAAGAPLLLLLLVTTVVVLLAALTLPILSIEQSGDLVTVNVWRAVAAFQAQHLTPLAALVAATTAVFPMLELASLCGLLACATFGWASPGA